MTSSTRTTFAVGPISDLVQCPPLRRCSGLSGHLVGIGSYAKHNRVCKGCKERASLLSLPDASLPQPIENVVDLTPILQIA